MHTSELSNSRYLSKKDLIRPVLVTIDRVDHENIALEGEEDKLRYICYFRETVADGKKKGLVLGPTVGNLIAQITGSEDSDGWTGKKIVLYVDPTVSMMGKVVGGIRVRAPRIPAPAKAAAPVQRQAPAPAPVAAAEPADGEEPDPAALADGEDIPPQTAGKPGDDNLPF